MEIERPSTSDRLTRLEAQMEAMEIWRREFISRIDALEELISETKAENTRQFIALLTVLVSGFIAVIAGLLYIILNHVLMP